jgi:membrane protein DedA with SNARE-associated domain
MLAQLSDLLIQLVNQFGYVGVFLASTLESFFIPLPGEVIAFTAGYVARSQESILALILMSIFITLGNYVGSVGFYFITRRGAETFLPRFIDRWGPFLLITQEDMDKVERLFAKHGGKMVFFSKFVPGVKNLIDFPAGVSKMPFLTFSFYTLLGSFIRNVILCGVGYFAYSIKDQVIAILSPIEKLVLIVLAVAIVIYVGRVVFRIRQLSIERKNLAELQKTETLV